MNATPQIAIPQVTVPVPNAQDDYRRAAKLVTDEAVIYDAMDVLEGKRPTPGSPLTPASITAWLKANAAALASLRAGFDKAYCEYPARVNDAHYSDHTSYCKLARILYVDAMMRMKRGDATGAMRSGLDGIELGTTIPHGGMINASSSGRLCSRTTRTPLWDMVHHLSAADARAHATRLERIALKRITFTEEMEAEKWGQIAMLLKYFQRSDWRKLLLGTVDDNGNMRVPPQAYLISKREIVARYTHYMDARIANAKSPHGYRLPMPVLQLPTPLNSILAPEIFNEDEHVRHYNNYIQDDLLLLTLALRAYAIEHKRYPVALRDLTPDYLKALPVDPYASSGTYIYTLTKKGYLLYSLGPDNADNSGRPCKEGQYSATGSTGLINATSTGDIVAGINVR